MTAKNYDGHIYIKNNLKEILNTDELNTINSSVSVLLFPSNVTLEQAAESLKTIRTIIKDQIKRRDEMDGSFEER